MKLHDPFIITSTLSPGIKIGDSVLHLLDASEVTEDNRDRAKFLLVTPGFDYEESGLSSGVGGFHNTVEVFEMFLSFLLAAVESAEYEMRTGLQGENTDLFPKHVVEWALEHKDAIEMAICDITDEDGAPNESLIEE